MMNEELKSYLAVPLYFSPALPLRSPLPTRAAVTQPTFPLFVHGGIVSEVTLPRPIARPSTRRSCKAIPATKGSPVGNAREFPDANLASPRPALPPLILNKA